MVVDENDVVLKASAPAYALGLVRANEMVDEELASIVRQVRRDGQTGAAEHERGPDEPRRTKASDDVDAAALADASLVHDPAHAVTA